jgi:MerR family transcriptional regulator, light-induced transcriptional regulator
VPATPHADLDGLRADYLAALLARDSHHARVVVERALAGGADPAAVDLEVLAPTLRELGDRWERGELTVAEEHFATGITEGVMAMVAERMRRPPVGGRLAVVACPPGERHGVPARMLGDFLESAGWEVLVVGSDVPVRDLLELVEDEQPDVVCVSVTMAQTIDAAFEVLGALGTADPRPLLAIGGQAWDGTLRIAGAVGADVVASDPVELLRVLQERLPPLPDEDPEAQA